MVSLGQEEIIESVWIIEDDGFTVQMQLCPSEGLKHFIHGAKSTRQGDKGIRHIDHHEFPAVHVRYYDQLCHAFVCHFLLLERDWNDPGSFSTPLHDRIRHDPHEANAPAAIDQPDLVFNK